MILNESNLVEKINSYTREDWKPLIDLIPKIESLDKFGDDAEAMKLLKKEQF